MGPLYLYGKLNGAGGWARTEARDEIWAKAGDRRPGYVITCGSKMWSERSGLFSKMPPFSLHYPDWLR